MAVVLGVCDVERPQIRLHTRQGPFEKSQPHVPASIKINPPVRRTYRNSSILRTLAQVASGRPPKTPVWRPYFARRGPLASCSPRRRPQPSRVKGPGVASKDSTPSIVCALKKGGQSWI